MRAGVMDFVRDWRKTWAVTCRNADDQNKFKSRLDYETTFVASVRFFSGICGAGSVAVVPTAFRRGTSQGHGSPCDIDRQTWCGPATDHADHAGRNPGNSELYLSGKIRQWYSRGDGKGVILFIDAKTVEGARAVKETMPLAKEGVMDHEYIPVGPLMPLGVLIGGPAR